MDHAIATADPQFRGDAGSDRRALRVPLMSDVAQAHLQEQFEEPTQQREASTLGMWQFLATEVLFFGVLFAAYAVCRFRFPDGFAEAARHTHVVYGTIETAVLLVSSAGAALALRNVELAGRRVAEIGRAHV